jgi:hypothetical protein
MAGFKRGIRIGHTFDYRGAENKQEEQAKTDYPPIFLPSYPHAHYILKQR